LDKIVSIDIEIIANITGFPSRGMDPTKFLDDKSREKALAEEMKKKYGTDRGTRGIIIKRINDAATQLGTKNISLQVAKKMPQGGSSGWSCHSCSSVHRGHHSELGTVPLELVPG
jgi:hypothetical protein